MITIAVKIGLLEAAMVDLLRRLWGAIRELAAAPLDWNGLQMLALVVLAIALFVAVIVISGGTTHG